MVGNNAPKPLAAEFCRCSGQLQMGLSLSAAIRALTRRVPLAEMRILAATLMVQRQTGGNLPVTLERLAQVCRDRLSYYRQFRAATAAGRGAAILIAAISVGAAAYLLFGRPEYAQDFFEQPQGYAMLAIAIGLMIIGLTWIFKLLKVDY